jgi:hypothetical protein
MASEKRPPQQRRRRPPAVINLEATEVDPAAAEQRAAPAAEPPGAAPAQPAPPKSEAPKSEDVFIPPPPERPASAPRGEGPSQPPPSDPPRGGPARRPIAWLPDGLSSATVGHAVSAIVGGLLVFALIWLTGALSGPREAAVDLRPRLTTIERQLQDLAARPVPASVDPTRLAAIERQLQDLVRDLAARPVPASFDPKAIDDLAARMTRLESAQSAPRAPVTDPVVLSRLGAAEQAAKGLADNVAALARRSDSVEGALRDNHSRLERMAAALNEMRTAARSAAAGADRAARLALAVGSLRVAVERSEPFAAELAAVKPLTADGAAVAALEPFADKGVPSSAALSQELVGLVKPMLRSGGEPRRDGGFLERMQASAENLVRVRPVGDVAGDDRDAILARVEQRAAQGNVPGALAELAKLSPQARAPAEPWIAKAEARNQAIEASRRLAAEAVAALKEPR